MVINKTYQNKKWSPYKFRHSLVSLSSQLVTSQFSPPSTLPSQPWTCCHPLPIASIRTKLSHYIEYTQYWYRKYKAFTLFVKSRHLFLFRLFFYFSKVFAILILHRFWDVASCWSKSQVLTSLQSFRCNTGVWRRVGRKVRHRVTRSIYDSSMNVVRPITNMALYFAMENVKRRGIMSVCIRRT